MERKDSSTLHIMDHTTYADSFMFLFAWKGVISNNVPTHGAVPTHLSFEATLSADWWLLIRILRRSSNSPWWANAKKFTMKKYEEVVHWTLDSAQTSRYYYMLVLHGRVSYHPSCACLLIKNGRSRILLQKWRFDFQFSILDFLNFIILLKVDEYPLEQFISCIHIYN